MASFRASAMITHYSVVLLGANRSAEPTEAWRLRTAEALRSASPTRDDVPPNDGDEHPGPLSSAARPRSPGADALGALGQPGRW